MSHNVKLGKPAKTLVGLALYMSAKALVGLATAWVAIYPMTD